MELVWPLVLFVILVAVRTKDKYGAKNIPNSKYTTYLSFPSKLLMVLRISLNLDKWEIVLGKQIL